MMHKKHIFLTRKLRAATRLLSLLSVLWLSNHGDNGDARAARFFFLIQPIKSLICGGAAAVVISLTPYSLFLSGAQKWLGRCDVKLEN